MCVNLPYSFSNSRTQLSFNHHNNLLDTLQYSLPLCDCPKHCLWFSPLNTIISNSEFFLSFAVDTGGPKRTQSHSQASIPRSQSQTLLLFHKFNFTQLLDTPIYEVRPRSRGEHGLRKIPVSSLPQSVLRQSSHTLPSSHN